MMPGWAMVFLGGVVTLLCLKLAYVLAAGWSLPVTRGALFVPTANVRIRAFLNALSMAPVDRFVELGCGDGRVLRAVQQTWGCSAVGYEVNPLAFLLARLRTVGSRGIEVRWGNFWDQDLSRADVVFCYLFPDVMARLAMKLGRELRPGARVVSCNFKLPGWRPERVIIPDAAGHEDPIFIYRIPAAYPHETRAAGG